MEKRSWRWFVLGGELTTNTTNSAEIVNTVKGSKNLSATIIVNNDHQGLFEALHAASTQPHFVNVNNVILARNLACFPRAYQVYPRSTKTVTITFRWCTQRRVSCWSYVLMPTEFVGFRSAQSLAKKHGRTRPTKCLVNTVSYIRQVYPRGETGTIACAGALNVICLVGRM